MAPTPTCPPGMKLIAKGGPIHPNEPAYCISVTEVTQKADQQFWAKRLKLGWELLVKLRSGKQTRETGKEAPLRARAAKQIRKPTVSTVTVQRVAGKGKRQPKGNLAGDKKPAIYRNWNDARTYCQSVYPGGDPPTGRQWEKACGAHGDRKYCTASGKKSKLEKEADYGRSWSAGPKDVDAFPPNPNGIRGMTGGVWEWTLDDDGRGDKIIRGGSWGSESWVLRTDSRGHSRPGDGDGSVGFRCVAPPRTPK